MTYCATPGYADRVFILPDALRNQPEVTLLIKARTAQMHRLEHRHGAEGDTGAITSDMPANKQVRRCVSEPIAVKSNK